MGGINYLLEFYGGVWLDGLNFYWFWSFWVVVCGVGEVLGVVVGIVGVGGYMGLGIGGGFEVVWVFEGDWGFVELVGMLEVGG